MTQAEVKDMLAKAGTNFQDRTLGQIDASKSSLAAAKGKAVDDGDQGEAKSIWCLERSLLAQQYYIEAFVACKAGKYYEGWCALEKAEIATKSVKKHQVEYDAYHIDYMSIHIPRFQKIFPYKLFFSPEMIGRNRCQICNRVITPRSTCGHIKGEVYDGVQCLHKVEQLSFLGMAIVKNPVQKYSVVMLSEGDQHDYSLVKYYIDAVDSPFDAWDLIETTKMFPHDRFVKVGRNDDCPCGGPKKYKKCCLKNDGVVMPHFQFAFSKASKSANLENRLIHDKAK